MNCFLNKNFVAVFLFSVIASWSACSQEKARVRYIKINTHHDVIPFLRRGDTNILVAQTNDAVGLSTTETKNCIDGCIADAITQHGDKSYDIGIFIKFNKEKRYTVHEYRITNSSDEA